MGFNSAFKGLNNFLPTSDGIHPAHVDV